MRDEQLRIICALLSNPVIAFEPVDYDDTEILAERIVKMSEIIMSKINSESTHIGLIPDATTE